jgi:signal transduction histidine kinase/HAMP domain-containing protein
VAALSQQVGVDFSIWPLPASSAGTPATVPQDVFYRQMTEEPFFLHEQSEELLWAYTTVADLQGKPAVLLRAEVPREITRAGNVVVRFTMLSILAVGMMVLLAMLVFLRRAVTDPIALLTQHALAIKTTGDLSARLILQNDDEIGVLAREFNDMVAQVKGRAAELAQVNEALRREIAERERAEGELRRQNAYLAALHETALALMNRLELADVFTTIVTRAAQLLDTVHGYVYLGEAGATEIELKVGTGVYVDYVGYRLKPDEGLAGKVWHSGQPLLVSDYDIWPGRSPQYPYGIIHAAVGMPLKSGPQVVGVIGLAHVEAGRTFGEQEVELLTRFAGLASIALDNARLFQEEQRRRQEAETLRRAALTLTTTLERNRVIERILAELREVVPYDSASVQLLREDRLEIIGGRGFPNLPDLLGVSFSLHGHNPNAEVARTRAPLIIEDAPTLYEEFQRGAHAPARIRSWLGVPMLVEDRLIGMIALDKREPGFYTREHARLAEAFAAQAAITVENARLFEQTRRTSEELKTVGAILRALNAAPDVTQVFPAAAAGVRALTDCQRVSLALLDERQERVTITALDLPRPELPRGATLPLVTTAAAADVLIGHLHLTPDLAAEADYPAERSLYQAGYRSRINLPLRVGAQVIGALNLAWSRPIGYRQANLTLLGQIADAVALALERSRLFTETHRHAAILKALAYASEMLLSPGDIGAVLPDVLVHLGRAAGVSRAYIFENHLTPDGTLLTSQRYEWVAPGQTAQIDNPALQNFPYREGGFGRWAEMLGAGRPLQGLVRDFPDAERAILESQGIISIIVAPIFCEGVWWGFLGFDECEQERAWSAAEIEALKSVAGALGAAFARQRSEAAEREQRTLAEALRDTVAALTSTLSFDEVLDRILAEVGRVVPHDAANIMLIESGVARIVRCRGYAERGTEAVVLALRFPAAEVPNLRQMLETGQPSIIPDTQSCSGWVDIPESRWVRSYISAPIRLKGQIVGFLNLDSANPGFFTAAHAERLQAFANQAGVAVENARLYAEIRRHAAELERRVAERTAELSQREAALQVANEKLKELDQLKSRFVSNVSHELRTPLANIKVILYLLEKGRLDKHDYYMDTLNRETDLLQHIIEDLLQLSRLDLGATQLALAPVDLNYVVGMLAADRATLIASRRLSLQTDLAPDLPLVLADGKMLMQVITNLMTNAMNYTPPGGTITVRTAVHATEEGTWVTFSVSDTGPGITPEDQAHLFERFYRGKAGYQSQAPGTGLGLAICRELVERHGGKITLETEVRRGSTFTVWLPAMEQQVDRGS